MLTAIIIVARVQPGTSKGITDLLLPQPSSVLKVVSGPSSWQTPCSFQMQKSIRKHVP